ncbi:MAG: tetratricopeptide repeat protein [Deltaproteobacteria bacterium]|nr:tetratricopeptide repeat protein [Deltaproteobacteria bacterium]MBN2670372.1 tetratricopeptide repeat protein [Deltaproteobacteria bacterium]
MTKDINRENLDKSFEAAKKSLAKAWDSEDAWDHLEEFAETDGYDELVAEVYTSALESSLPSEVFEMVAQRAVSFYDEWFGDTPKQSKQLLSRIIEIDANAGWAFNRLTELLSSVGDWDTLFDTYDKALERNVKPERKIQLLEEAANIARDMADLPDKALNYLLSLQRLDKGNKTRLKSIERMLEKRERWEELIELWQQQLDIMTPDAALATRLEIARCYIDKLISFEKALEIIEAILKEHAGNVEACALGESILTNDAVSIDIRLRALELVLMNYQASDQPEAVVRVIEAALEFVESEQKVALYRKAGATLSILGKDEEAMASYGALLVLDPTDGDAIKQLRLLSVRSKRFDLRADALIRAADATNDDVLKVSHLTDAAELYVRHLGNATEAIEIYAGLLTIENIEPGVALKIAHNLNELLSAQDRDSERLAVLEKIASLESTSMVRRTVYQEAARLAEQLSLTERALAFWNAVLNENDNDSEALGASINLMHQTEQWDEAIQYLTRRAEAAVLKEQRRNDLVQIAAIQLNYQENIAAAIKTWKLIFDEFGPRHDCVAQLDTLLSQEGRFDELADLLQQASGKNFNDMQQLLLRLGDVCRIELNQPLRALEYYQNVLALNIHHEGAVEAVATLLNEESCRNSAVRVIERIYMETRNWNALLRLTEFRLAAADRVMEKVDILEEAAVIYEQELEDLESAFQMLCNLIPMSPANSAAIEKLVRLAEVTEFWEQALAALTTATNNSPAGSLQQVQLLTNIAKIQEVYLEDAAAALQTYLAIQEAAGQSTEVSETIIRLSAKTYDWKNGAEAVMNRVEQTGKFSPDNLKVLETAADANDAWLELATAFEEAIRVHNALIPTMVRDMNMLLSVWYQEQCENVDKAKEAVKRAVDATPDYLPARRRLAVFQRETPTRALLENLRAIYKLSEDDLDPLMEASTTAVSVLEEYEESRTFVVGLYEEATKQWRLGTILKGKHTAEECALHAVTQIAQLDLENGLKERASHFLMDGAKLPFDDSRSRFLRRKAAMIFTEIGMNAVAIDVYNQVLARNPEDMETMLELDALLEREQRILELLALRQKRLALTDDLDTQISLRLDISSLGGLLEGSDSRLALLKENLQQFPGEPKTVAAIESLLEKRGMHKELVDLFWNQSQILLENGRPQEAAGLMEVAARVSQHKLNDVEFAIAAYRKVVDLKNTTQALDALAKLYAKKGDLAESVLWLKTRLEQAEPEERVSTMIRLARTQLKIGRLDEAVSVLENAFELAPQNAEVRKLLLERYREQNEFAKLADALERSIFHMHDSKTILAYAREAAHVIFDELQQPKKAVSVLQKIVELAPDSKDEQSMLAEALLDAEQYDEAKVMLEEILEGFGRRRSPARAAIHAKLASVISAQGDVEEAISHLEQATRMDSHNVRIAKELAELARQKGDFELADRTYRSLLMTVRREQADTEEFIIGPAEILMELSFIAAEKEQTDKQLELEESALEALRANDAQAAAMEKRLIEKEAHDLLVRVLETRLGYLKKNVIRARVQSKLADIFEKYMDEKEKAFEIRLDAVKGDSSSPQNHDGAIRLAEDLGRSDEYIQVVEQLLSKTRRDVDALTRCELLLRLVAARLEQGNRLDEAIELFEQAKALEVREVDVIRMGARLADAKGDKELQVQLLTELSKMGESEDGTETQVDALFRLAEIHLSSEETFDEGIEQLNAAFDESGNCDRAGRILRRISKKNRGNESLLQVFERVSRKSEDRYLALEYFELLAEFATTTPAQMQEGAKLAMELNEGDRAEKLMERIIESAEEHPEFGESITWAMLGLGQKRLAQDDLAGAVKWFMDATGLTEDENVFAFGIEIAEAILREGDDYILASKVYEKLLDVKPGAQEAWGPLTDIYLKLGNIEGFECLVEETMYSMESPEERNLLRQKWAKLLLNEEGREADAVDVLKNILLDEPGHTDALAMLAAYYTDAGREEELLELLQDRFASAVERNAENEVKGLALELGKQLAETSEQQVLYRQALEIARDDKDLLLALIDTLEPQEDARERIELLERTLTSETGDAAAALTLKVAAAYRDMEDHGGATRTLKIGFARSPESEEIKSALEQDFRARADYDGLVELLKTNAAGIEDIRMRVMAFGEIADLYRDEINDVTGEVEALLQMADTLGENVDYIIRLIDAFRRSGKYEEALQKAAAALEVVGDEEKKYELLVLRAKMLKSRGDLQGALADLEVAVSINAEASDVYEAALIEQRNHAAADQNIDVEQDSVFKLTNLYVEQGRTEELHELLQSWLEVHTEDIDAWSQLLQLELAAENYSGVIEACKKLTVLTEGEEQLEIGSVLTKACLEIGEYEIARRGLEYIYKENIDGIRVRDDLKMVYEKIGAHHELATFLAHDAKATEDEAERAELFRKAGEAYLQAGDPDTALLALNESLALEPDNVESALVVIDIEIEQGDLDGAEAHVDGALEASGRRRSPQHAALQLKKAVIAEKRGDRMEQLAWLEQAAGSARTDGEIASMLADLAEELEEWEIALKALRNISLMKSDCPISKGESFFRQGRISYRLGDEKRAILYVKKAIQEDKDHAEAQAFLEQIS